MWDRSHVLRFMREGDAHTVELFWDEGWRFVGWYVNLQAPLVVRGDRFDTTDWALDVVVDPDGSWRWKDEDDFAQALALGVFDEQGAAEIRAEGARHRRAAVADGLGGLASPAGVGTAGAAGGLACGVRARSSAARC